MLLVGKGGVIMNKNYIASVIENIVTLIITFLFCKYISSWGLLLLLNLNSNTNN